MATPATKIRFREPQIEMAHGAGGKASRRLVEELFAPLLFGSKFSFFAFITRRQNQLLASQDLCHLSQ